MIRVFKTPSVSCQNRDFDNHAGNGFSSENFEHLYVQSEIENAVVGTWKLN
jgi:hypothetical protein